ncbi:MAG: hypothetical protein P4L84_20940 [Isosphaeraceae bacterium]|nr:hypothetical protein [Isosphaeraceae bacterium]
MRWILALVLTLCVLPCRGQTSPPPSTSETERAQGAAELARKAAEEYTIALGSDASEPLGLVTKPVLQWSNPVSGSIHGSVFVWTRQGRATAIASIYKWYAPRHHLGVEFHSLAAGPLVAKRAGENAWTPRLPGIELRPIPGAPAPADKPVARLAQMRALAKEFTASETTRENIRRELRRLSNPIFRNLDADAQFLDGALFAFVEGTDPEVVLDVQARRVAGADTFEWVYGLVRMNSNALRVAHRGREVWTIPEIPWREAFDHDRPYTLFTFQPGEGVNPPGPGDDEPSQ